MKLCSFFIGLVLIFTLLGKAAGQDITQTIRGKVIDKDARIPLPGANLIIAGSDPQIGTTTDENGEFDFGRLPVGKYNITVFMWGMK